MHCCTLTLVQLSPKFIIQFLPCFWTLLGGAGTIIGPLLGTGIMFYLIDFISGITSNYLLVVGVVLVLTIIWFPLGIMGTIRQKWLKWLP